MTRPYGFLLYRQLSGDAGKVLAGIFTGEDANEKCSTYEKEFRATLRRVSNNSISVEFWAVGSLDNPVVTEDLVLSAMAATPRKKATRTFRKQKSERLTREDWVRFLGFTRGTRFHNLVYFFHETDNTPKTYQELEAKGVFNGTHGGQFIAVLNQKLKKASLPFAIRSWKKKWQVFTVED